jgi:hypothetical protein
LNLVTLQLTDGVAAELQWCSKLQLLDIAYNDLTSDGVKLLGAGKLQHLQHLNLRSNVQVSILPRGAGWHAA